MKGTINSTTNLLAKIKIITIKRAAYACGLFFMLIVVGCSAPTPIGLNIQSAGDLREANMVDSFTINTQMLLLNKLTTSTGFYLFAGVYQDPDLGMLTSEGNIAIKPADNVGSGFADGPIFDSMVVTLPVNRNYNYGIYGKKQLFEIRQLSDTLGPGLYYNTTIKATESKVISKVSLIVSDTLQNIRFRLDSIGKQITRGGNILLNDPNIFNLAIKGINIRADSIKDGAVVGFDVSSGALAIIYYHTAANAAPQIVPLNISYNNPHFNKITSNLSGTPFSSLQANGDTLSSKVTNGLCAIQSGSGIRTLLTFPSLTKIKAAIGNGIITKAELVVTPLRDLTLYPTPIGIALARSDGTNNFLYNTAGAQLLVLNDLAKLANQGTSTFNFNTITNSFNMIVTAYVQDVANGKLPNTPLILTTVGAGTSINRVTFNDNRTGDITNRLRLKVYYTPN